MTFDYEEDTFIIGAINREIDRRMRGGDEQLSASGVAERVFKTIYPDPACPMAERHDLVRLEFIANVVLAMRFNPIVHVGPVGQLRAHRHL